MFVLQCDMCGNNITTQYNLHEDNTGPNCMKIEWEQLRYMGDVEFFASSEYTKGSLCVCSKCAGRALEYFAVRGKIESF